MVHYFLMNETKTSQKQWRPVKIPLTDEEFGKVKAFLSDNSSKLGPWLRRLILDEIARREAIERGATQIDFDALRRRSTSDNSRAVPGVEVVSKEG